MTQVWKTPIAFSHLQGTLDWSMNSLFPGVCSVLCALGLRWLHDADRNGLKLKLSRKSAEFTLLWKLISAESKRTLFTSPGPHCKTHNPCGDKVPEEKDQLPVLDVKYFIQLLCT